MDRSSRKNQLGNTEKCHTKARGFNWYKKSIHPKAADTYSFQVYTEYSQRDTVV